jgi:hypothetical protein
VTASYTGHGHHIPGTPVKTPPKQLKLCGGPGICLPCSTDAIRASDAAYMLFSNPAEVNRKVKPLMSEAPIVPTTIPTESPTLFEKAKEAIMDLGHDATHAEVLIENLFSKGIGFRKIVSQADAEADKVKPFVDEAVEISKDVPELQTAEPVLEEADKLVDEGVKDADTVEADVEKVDPEPVGNTLLSDTGPRDSVGQAVTPPANVLLSDTGPR